MFVRIISGVIAVALLFCILYLCPVWAIPLALMVLNVIAVHEFLAATKFVKNRAMLIAAVVFSTLVIPWVYRGADYTAANIAVFLFAAFLFALALGSQRQVTLEQIGGAFFAAIFIPLAFSSIIRIRLAEHGIYLILLPFICAYMTDTCAYFTGIFLGRTKMAPGISPKKSWEGSVGGMAGCVAGMFLYGLLLNLAFRFAVNWAILAFVGVFGSAAAQFGDLCFSYINRQFGIKDYGRIIPGHGGVLDRCDSLLFAAPTVELILTITGGLLLTVT